MPAPPLDRFRAGFERNLEAMNRGEVEAAFAWVPPELEWHPLDEMAEASVTDVPRVARGPQEVKALFRMALEEWGWRSQPLEFQALGDDSIVVRMVGWWKGPHSGLEARVRFTQTWEFSDDGGPIRVRESVEGTGMEASWDEPRDDPGALSRAVAAFRNLRNNARRATKRGQ